MQKSIFTSIIMELCCSLMLILPIISYSQQGDGYYDNNFNISHFAPNVSYASPEATTLGKYVDIPVSLYTGVPSIIVPIYSIQASNLTIPINLSYHASGIKVEEVA